MTLNPASRRVRARGQPVDLWPVEFSLLNVFLSNPERVFSRDELLNRVWGRDAYIEDRTIDVHIYRLRKVSRPFGLKHSLQTIPGAGYRFS